LSSKELAKIDEELSDKTNPASAYDLCQTFRAVVLLNQSHMISDKSIR